MILHLTPRAVETLYGAGNWKAAQALRLLLRESGVDYEVRVFDGDRPDAAGMVGPEVTDVIMEYTRWPQLLRGLRSSVPGVRIHARAVNAEALQHAHRTLCPPQWRPSPVRALYGVFRLLRCDVQFRRGCDTILGISAWDNRHYWRHMPGRARILDVPYFCPWPDIRLAVHPMPWHDRTSTVACLAGARDPVGQSAMGGFLALAAVLRREEAFRDWQFVASAGVYPGKAAEVLPDYVQREANLVEPWDLLCRCKVIAMLTPLGFGFKTTVADGLAAGCHVVVHPRQHRRLPAALASHVQVWDPAHGAVPRELMGRWLQEPPPNQANRELRETALTDLRKALWRQA